MMGCKPARQTDSEMPWAVWNATGVRADAGHAAATRLGASPLLPGAKDSPMLPDFSRQEGNLDV